MIIERFEQTAAEHKDKTAIETYEEKITYGALNHAAGLAARMILELCRPSHPTNTTAGILVMHGIHQVTALLAVLKARMIYVPLDPAYPRERLERMIEDAGITVILTDEYGESLVRELCFSSKGEEEIQMLRIDEIVKGNLPISPRGTHPGASRVPSQEGIDGGDASEQDQAAYILYTSGSTGRPKGVVQTRRNVCFYTDVYIKALSITHRDRVTYLSSFSHDGAIQDIYSALLSGAVLCPLDIRPGGKFNVGDIGEWLIKEEITMYHSVPTVFRYAAAAIENGMVFPRLRLIVTGGEKLYPNDLRLAGKYFPGVALAHMYGQTESSVNTMGFIDTGQKTGKVFIGEPLEGIELLLLNPEGEQVDTYEEGEIFVVSPHIATGYWKDPETSAKVFLFDEDLGPIYRTGDMGKLNIDGRIEFTGRKDHQVKIRGFRIEPGEIEARLLEHENVKEAVVVALEKDTGETYLCAYIVPKNPPGPTDLAAFLSTTLPIYMVPDFFIPIDNIPLTSTGKTDRKALPAPELRPTPGDSYKAPGDEMEMKLVEICAGILRLDKNVIGMESNFLQLGAHSLSLISLIAEIRKEFKCEVSLVDIFANPTMAEISYLIKAKVYTETEVFSLNPWAQKKIFCFPPRIGYGVSYQALSSLMPGYSLHAFNFIEEENRLRQYLDMITDRQADGPYVLMGWSAGGTLTVNVAAALEQQGSAVSDIILVDCRGQDPENRGKTTWENEKGFIDKIGAYIEELGLGFLKEKAERKMEIYTRYNLESPPPDTVDAHVHFILSRENEDRKRERASPWRAITRKTFTLYQGFGEHEDMLLPGPVLEKNAALLREILNDIFSDRETVNSKSILNNKENNQ